MIDGHSHSGNPTSRVHVHVRSCQVGAICRLVKRTSPQVPRQLGLPSTFHQPSAHSLAACSTAAHRDTLQCFRPRSMLSPCSAHKRSGSVPNVSSGGRLG